jgi:hydroxymethylglutaryl-CoA lyase
MMSDLPMSVRINEEGPREGFQIESAAIPARRKIELIDALADTGIRHMQVVSFVSPTRVPGMADAEEVVRGITPRSGVKYTGLWLNEKGLERAIATGRLTIEGKISLAASERFQKRNQNKTIAEQIDYNHRVIDMYREHGIPVTRASVMAAFGCNFEGDIAPEKVVSMVDEIVRIAAAHGETIEVLSLADTMAWATPESIKRVVGAVRNRHPSLQLSLHLHDTRGMGIANAYAGLQMGVDRFDASVAGLGGCPFAGHKSAAGNVCTEDLVFMCEEMGIGTGIDLERLLDCARLAEEVVSHALPGAVMHGGSLKKLRQAIHAGH